MGRKSHKPNAIPRLRARPQKSGKVHYYYDHGGKPRKEEPLGADYGLAILRWAEIERETNPPHVPAIITFRYVAEKYREEVIPTKAPATQQGNAKQLANLLAFFDDPPIALAAIQPIHVRKYLTWRKDAPISANREKALLSHIWNFARNEGYTALANPCAGIKGTRERSREIYVTDEQYAQLWTAACDPLRDAMDMAYITGQRPADVLRMTEHDIVDNAYLHVRQGKTQKKLRIEISADHAAVIARIRARKHTCEIYSTSLIVDERGMRVSATLLRSRFDSARERTGVTFQFRDLRAKAGTDKTESSGDIRQAQKQLGHGSVTTTEGYIRQRLGDKVTSTK